MFKLSAWFRQIQICSKVSKLFHEKIKTNSIIWHFLIYQTKNSCQSSFVTILSQLFMRCLNPWDRFLNSLHFVPCTLYSISAVMLHFIVQICKKKMFVTLLLSYYICFTFKNISSFWLNIYLFIRNVSFNILQ